LPQYLAKRHTRLAEDPESTTDSASDGHAPDQTGWIRRADVSLRIHYPNLVTRIFEIAPHRYSITFDKSLQDAAKIDFEQFRPVTLQATISNEAPTTFIREIPSLPDNQLARNFEGFPFTAAQLFNLVVSRFPDLPIVMIRDGGTPMAITVELTRAPERDQERQLLDFCNGIGVPAPFKVSVTGRPVDTTTSPSPRAFGPVDDALLIRASRLRPAAPPFVRADEAYWFSNLDQIYAGNVAVEQIPGIEEGQARCFIDATIGEHVNLRQLLTLYDTIYVSPPLREGHDAFLAKQAVTDNDLLTLIERGRLKIISTQAEERLKISFLAEAAERSPSAIIGRRTTAAMLIADIVQTADEYRLRDSKHYPAIGELSKVLSEKSGLPADQILEFILWPVQARRAAVWPLLDRGSKGIPPIGMGPFFATFIEKIGKKDLKLESLIISEKVHIGHALNATVFPPREEPEGLHRLANAMGDCLNFFRSFNTRIAAAWVGNVERKEAGKLLLPPLPLFEFDPAIPIEEILAATDRSVMRNRGRALFGRLADMTEEQRAVEIQNLNTALRRYGQPSGVISLDNLDTGISVASIAYGFAYPPLAGLQALGRQLIDLGRKYPAVDKLLEAIQVDLFPAGGKKRELDFLSSISRVATLKTAKVS
jgi:hypothetical protein